MGDLSSLGIATQEPTGKKKRKKKKKKKKNNAGSVDATSATACSAPAKTLSKQDAKAKLRAKAGKKKKHGGNSAAAAAKKEAVKRKAAKKKKKDKTKFNQ